MDPEGMRNAWTTKTIMNKAMTMIEASDCKCSGHERTSFRDEVTSAGTGAADGASGSGMGLVAILFLAGEILLLLLEIAQGLLRYFLLRILLGCTLSPTDIHSLAILSRYDRRKAQLDREGLTM